MTSTGRMSLGTAGERHVRRYLEQRGLAFVEANWRCRWGEIDLVFRDGPELVFVEVKTRRGVLTGAAVEAVSPAKGRKLLRAAVEYLQLHPEFGEPIWRIDIAALQLGHSGRVESLELVENAVLADQL